MPSLNEPSFTTIAHFKIKQFMHIITSLTPSTYKMHTNLKKEGF
jgi:hypothetical protein